VGQDGAALVVVSRSHRSSEPQGAAFRCCLCFGGASEIGTLAEAFVTAEGAVSSIDRSLVRAERRSGEWNNVKRNLIEPVGIMACVIGQFADRRVAGIDVIVGTLASSHAGLPAGVVRHPPAGARQSAPALGQERHRCLGARGKITR
jgi:hypothetical protein